MGGSIDIRGPRRLSFIVSEPLLCDGNDYYRSEGDEQNPERPRGCLKGYRLITRVEGWREHKIGRGLVKIVSRRSLSSDYRTGASPRCDSPESTHPQERNSACASDATHFWQLAPRRVALHDREVHVWRASLKQSASHVRSLVATLAPEEQQRAERYVFQKDREHFIVARGLLRSILGMYLEMEPRALRFCYSSYGKPRLALEDNHGDLRFNLSHSNQLALFAVTRGREVGVDVEWIRPEVAKENIAEHFFSRYEVTMLRSLPPDLQGEAFFNCWTRKEAYIKARGEGLSLPLDKFDVSLAPGKPATLLSIRIDSVDTSQWTLVELTPGLGYAAALVVEGRDWQLKCWKWP